MVVDSLPFYFGFPGNALWFVPQPKDSFQKFPKILDGSLILLWPSLLLFVADVHTDWAGNPKRLTFTWNSYIFPPFFLPLSLADGTCSPVSLAFSFGSRHSNLSETKLQSVVSELLTASLWKMQSSDQVHSHLSLLTFLFALFPPVSARGRLKECGPRPVLMSRVCMVISEAPKQSNEWFCDPPTWLTAERHGR